MYIGLSFDRATGGDSRVLAGLLSWGLAATAGNFAAGRLTDLYGSRRIINAAIAVLVANFALLPLTPASLVTSVPALVAWGVCGSGMLVPQQHRLISIMPAAALLLGLSTAAIYIGVSMPGAIGGATITWLDPTPSASSARFLLGWRCSWSNGRDSGSRSRTENRLMW